MAALKGERMKVMRVRPSALDTRLLTSLPRLTGNKRV